MTPTRRPVSIRRIADIVQSSLATGQTSNSPRRERAQRHRDHLRRLLSPLVVVQRRPTGYRTTRSSRWSRTASPRCCLSGSRSFAPPRRRRTTRVTASLVLSTSDAAHRRRRVADATVDGWCWFPASASYSITSGRTTSPSRGTAVPTGRADQFPDRLVLLVGRVLEV